MKKFSVLFFFVLGLVCVSNPVLAKTIKIGLICPLTGSWASEGQDMEKIVKLLAEQINTKGGLLGKKVEVIVEDDGGDPRTAALAAQRLSSQDIVGVIGTYGSSVTEATQNIFNESKIIQIANGSTAIRLTEKGLKYFFRTCPRDDEQGKVAAEYIMKSGFKRVAILHDNTTYARGLAEETKSLLQKKGLNIVFFDALTPGESDYSPILTNLKAKNPDVVFFTGYYPEAGLLLRQKMEMGWNVQFIGGDATNNPDLVKIAGKDAAKGFLFLSPPVPQDLDTKEAKDFLAAYKRKYNSLPGSVWAVLSGDGFLALTTAIKATKSTDPDVLANYLHNKLNLSGLTGQIAFDSKGDRVGALYRIYRVDAKGNFILQ
ncbi:MAG: branched-chain amino acid ABC transporter substrate-binding protein [Desulfonauticus sp.]|nr:branched-chain amino acid ABC transporter substrate-binding protein [Desulfonauticus sp.]